MVGSLLMVAGLAMAAGPNPAAMVLSARGQVVIKPAEGQQHTASPKGLLYPGDRLSVPPEGEATLVFFDGGAKERVKPGAQITVGSRDSTPAGSVERLAPASRAVAATMQDIRLISSGKHAMTPGRDKVPEVDPPPAVSPIVGATVLTDRPALSWKPSPDTKEYHVRLVALGSNRLIWDVTTTEPKLAYPEAKPPLARSSAYSWVVTNAKGLTIVQGRFSVATDEDARMLAEVVPLARGSEPAEAFGVLDAALAAYQRLAAMSPGEPAFQERVTELEKRAGLVVKGEPKR
jgi:hypothetical protein